MSFANESDVCMYYGLHKNGDGTTESLRTVDDADRLFRDGFLSLGQDVRVLNDRMPVLMRTAVERMRAEAASARRRHRLAAAALFVAVVPPAPL